jgi:hypothetical protein
MPTSPEKAKQSAKHLESFFGREHFDDVRAPCALNIVRTLMVSGQPEERKLLLMTHQGRHREIAEFYEDFGFETNKCICSRRWLVSTLRGTS